MRYVLCNPDVQYKPYIYAHKSQNRPWAVVKRLHHHGWAHDAFEVRAEACGYTPSNACRLPENRRCRAD